MPHIWTERHRWCASAMVLVALLCVACTASAVEREDDERGELIVFAAASLTNAVDELAATFERAHPGTTIVRNYGGSSSLATQLLEGGRADIFAAANVKQMQSVEEAGLLAAPPVIFATNRLVIIVPADNPAAIDSAADLARAGVRLVLASPGVPARDYADAMLASLAEDRAAVPQFAERVLANVVSEETNVRQVVAKVALGEADAGIVYASDVKSETGAKVLAIEVAEEHNVRAVYPIAPLGDGKNAQLAQAFIDFVLSTGGQAILERWGFGAATS